MRQTTRRGLATACVAVGLAMVGTGCGAAADKIGEESAERLIESQTGADVDLDVSDGGYRVETEDGAAEFGGGIPEGWPTDVPVPDDLTVAGGMSSNDGSQMFASVTGTTSLTLDETLGLYEDGLSDWEKTQTIETSGEVRMVNVGYESGTRVLAIGVSDDGDVRSVSLSYTEE